MEISLGNAISRQLLLASRLKNASNLVRSSVPMGECWRWMFGTPHVDSATDDGRDDGPASAIVAVCLGPFGVSANCLVCRF